MGLTFNIGKHDYNIELSESVPVDISYCSNSGDHSILRQAVDKLLKFNVLVPKTDGSQRLILNLKALNRYVIYHRFKMKNLNRARKLMSGNRSMRFIDLEEAYYSVPIAQVSRKYLRFMFDGFTYEFACTPFDLSSAPYIFARLMKVVFSLISGIKGVMTVVYLDDYFLVFLKQKVGAY